MEDPLEIIISAVDEASATMNEVGEAAEAMGEEINESLVATQSAFDSTQASFDTFIASWNAAEEAVAGYSNAMEISIDQVMADMEEFGISAQQAADEIVAANTKISESATTTAEATGASAGAYAGLAAIAGIAFLGLKSAISDAVSSAMEWDETSAQIVQILKDTGSAIPLAEVQAYAEQLQSTTLFSQQDVLSSEALILSHKNLQSSFEDVTNIAADLATKMGTDLPNATRMLTNALTDPVAGLNQLIRQGNIDFPAATVTMIENMAKVGDTAGADELIIKALTGSIGGLATAAAGAPGAALTQLSNQITALGTVIGNDLLPLLDTIAKDLEPVIQDVTMWAEAHPKLTDAIVISAAALTGLLLVIGLVGFAIITVTPVVEAVGVVIAALVSPIGLAIAAVVAITAAIVLNWNTIKTVTEQIWNAISAFLTDNWETILDFFIPNLGTMVATFTTNWTEIKTVVETIWRDLSQFFIQGWATEISLFETSMSTVQAIWTTAWNNISAFVGNIWTTIQNTVKTGVDDVITAINAFINALDAIHISIPSISIPGTKLATPAVNLGFNIPNIPMLAAGGFVTQPTLALIGESGPEAVIPLSSGGAPGGQQIVINIQGGNYLDQQGATKIANELAKNVLRGLRPIVNYRT